MPSHEAFGGSLVDAVASVDCGPAERKPLLKNACLKAAMCGTVVDRCYSSIKPKAIAKLTAKNSRKLAAEGAQVIEDSRKVLATYKQTPSTAAASLGKLGS